VSAAKVSLVIAPLRAEIGISILLSSGHPTALPVQTTKTGVGRKAGSRTPSEKQTLSTVFIDDPSSNWFALAALIYGSAVMAIVIVALVKSARRRRVEAHKGR
jgi:hypothetical protein